MLITVPCRPLSELLQAPDHCSVLGEVNFTNCPLAGRVVIGIRMGIVRPEQAKLQEPLGAFGKRVAGVALLPGGRCPRCTSSMIKCTSASPASAHHVRNKINALRDSRRSQTAKDHNPPTREGGERARAQERERARERESSLL